MIWVVGSLPSLLLLLRCSPCPCCPQWDFTVPLSVYSQLFLLSFQNALSLSFSGQSVFHAIVCSCSNLERLVSVQVRRWKEGLEVSFFIYCFQHNVWVHLYYWSYFLRKQFFCSLYNEHNWFSSRNLPDSHKTISVLPYHYLLMWFVSVGCRFCFEGWLAVYWTRGPFWFRS